MANNIKIADKTLDYTIIPNSINNVNGVGTTSINGNSITWNIGTLPNGTITLKYRVQITSNLTSRITSYNVCYTKLLRSWIKIGSVNPNIIHNANIQKGVFLFERKLFIFKIYLSIQ